MFVGLGIAFSSILIIIYGTYFASLRKAFGTYNKETKMRVQPDHWAVILDYAQQHPEIITNKIKNINGREVLQQSWKELAYILNSLGMGEKKVEEWKKTVTDWKSKTKGKAVSISTHQGGTGGGPPPNITLTSLEERLLAIMGKIAIEGNVKIREVGLKRCRSPQTSQSDPNEQQPVKQMKVTTPIFQTLGKDQFKSFSISQIQNKPIPNVFAEQPQGLIKTSCDNIERPIQIRTKCTSTPKTQNRDGSSTSVYNNTTFHTSQSEIEKNTPTSTNRRTSSRHRETRLGEQLESMNNGVLRILESIDNRISTICDHLGELVKVMKDLKK